jgi:hypothetical protein
MAIAVCIILAGCSSGMPTSSPSTAPTTTSASSSGAPPFSSSAEITADISQFGQKLRTAGQVDLSSDSGLAQQIENVQSEGPFSSCTTGYPNEDPTPFICKLGDLKSTNILALMGDSHVWQWIGPLASIAKSRGWLLETFTKSACPASNVIYNLTPSNNAPSSMIGKPYTACQQWRDQVFKDIAALHPYLVVLSDETRNVPTSPTSFETGLTNSIDQFASDVTGHVASHVVYIADTPLWNASGVSPGECLSRSGLIVKYEALDTNYNFSPNPNVCYRNYAVNNSFGNIRQGMIAAAQRARATVIDPRPWICDTSGLNGICPPVIDGTLVYRDISHLTDKFANRLTVVIGNDLPPN